MILGQRGIRGSVLAKQVRAHGLAERFVDCSDASEDFVVEVRFPELEVGRALQLLACTLAVVDAREFHKDATVLELLDVGLGHAELVDALADDALGVVDGGLGFRTENLKDLGVRALGREEVLVLHVVEDAPQLHFRSASRPGGLKVGDEVGAVLFAKRLGLVERTAEVGVVAVVRKGNNEVGEADFERHAHPALEVKAEVEFLLLHVAVGVAKDRVDFGRCAVAEEFAGRLGGGFVEGLGSERVGAFQGIGYVSTVLIRGRLVSTRHPVERKGVQRRQGQQHCENDKDVLILHDR